MRSADGTDTIRKIAKSHARKPGFSVADLDPQVDEPDFDEPPSAAAAKPAPKAAAKPASRQPAKSRVAEMTWDAEPAPESGTVRVGKYKGLSFAEVYAADPDYCEWVLNKASDGALSDLADWMATVAPTLPPAKSGKIYLNVPFPRKEFAKQLGARWDSAKRLWYAPDASFDQLVAAFPRVDPS